MKRARYTIFYILIAAILLISCKSEFETLKIEEYTPSNNERGITQDAQVYIRFNNDVNKTDIEDNFSLATSTDVVSGEFVWNSGSSFTFVPHDNLTNNTRYVITLPREIRDRKGNKMESRFISDFYIGDDFDRPQITATTPVYTEGGTQDVALNSDIVIDFSKSMDTTKTEAAFTISPDVQGYFQWSQSDSGLDNSRLTFIHSEDFEYGVQYTITIDSSAADSTSNTLKTDYSLIFFTGSDKTAPTITGIHDASETASPAYWNTSALNEGISKTIEIAVQFSEDMDQEITESAFSISPTVSGRFSWDNAGKLIFRPYDDLTPETIYTITISTTATDANGNNLENSYSVMLKTNAADSSYVTLTQVQGSTDDATYSTLFTGSPNPANMPYAITISGGARYYLIIQFPVAMDRYSIYGNISLSNLVLESGAIEDITWLDDYRVKITLYQLVTSVLYRVKITGGSSGVEDSNGNNLESSIVVELQG